MTAPEKTSHTTSITAPLEVWAALDQVRASRARATGRRPLVRELVIEALLSFVQREAQPTR